MQTKIEISEGTVVTVAIYGSEAWALRKMDEDLLYVFQRNCPRIDLRTRLTNRISKAVQKM